MIYNERLLEFADTVDKSQNSLSFAECYKTPAKATAMLIPEYKKSSRTKLLAHKVESKQFQPEVNNSSKILLLLPSLLFKKKIYIILFLLLLVLFLKITITIILLLLKLTRVITNMITKKTKKNV